MVDNQTLKDFERNIIVDTLEMRLCISKGAMQFCTGLFHEYTVIIKYPEKKSDSCAVGKNTLKEWDCKQLAKSLWDLHCTVDDWNYCLLWSVSFIGCVRVRRLPHVSMILAANRDCSSWESLCYNGRMKMPWYGTADMSRNNSDKFRVTKNFAGSSTGIHLHYAFHFT